MKHFDPKPGTNDSGIHGEDWENEILSEADVSEGKTKN